MDDRGHEDEPSSVDTDTFALDIVETQIEVAEISAISDNQYTANDIVNDIATYSLGFRKLFTKNKPVLRSIPDAKKTMKKIFLWLNLMIFMICTEI
jgi:hypothetical protein